MAICMHCNTHSLCRNSNSLGFNYCYPDISLAELKVGALVVGEVSQLELELEL
jgi:hypothetical protein